MRTWENAASEREGGHGAEVCMAKAKTDPVATMTRLELLERIIELKNAVDWRDARLAEKDRDISWLREQLDAARATLTAHGICADSSRRSKAPS